MGARSILVDGPPIGRIGEVVRRIEPLDDNRHAWILGWEQWRSYAWSWSVWRWALDDGRLTLVGEGGGEGVGLAVRGGRVFFGGHSWEIRWRDLDGGASGAVPIEGRDEFAGCSPDGRYLVTRRAGARRTEWCRIRPVAGDPDTFPEVTAPLVFSDDSRVATYFGSDRASLLWIALADRATGSIAIGASKRGWCGICPVRGAAQMIVWDAAHIVVCDLSRQSVVRRVAVAGLVRVEDATAQRVVITTGGGDNSAIEVLELAGAGRVRLPRRYLHPALTPDGRRVVYLRGSVLDVIDAASGTVLSAHEGQCEHVRALVWSGDDTTVASSGDDGRVRLLRAGDRPRIVELGGTRNPAPVVAFSRDGRRLCAVTPSTIEVADVTTGAIVGRFASFGTHIHSAKISSDGRFLVVGSYGHGIRIFDIATGAQAASEGDATRRANRLVIAGDHIIAMSQERLAGPSLRAPVELVHWLRVDLRGAVLARGTWRFEDASSSIELRADGVAAMIAWYPRGGHRLCTIDLRAPEEPGRVVPVPRGAKLVDSRAGRALFLEQDDAVCRDPGTGDEIWRIHCPRWPWGASLSHAGDAVAVVYRDSGVELFVHAG